MIIVMDFITMKHAKTANCCKKVIQPTPSTYSKKAKNPDSSCGFLKLGIPGVLGDH